MAFAIYIRMKKAGKQRKEDLTPIPLELGQKPGTVLELLTALVRHSVSEYNERKDEGKILRYLTKEEIDARASSGKVSFGVRGGGDADPEKSLENAVQCFEDGIFRVFAGESELTELEQTIPWDGAEGNGETVFTFIRLTMLSGW